MSWMVWMIPIFIVIVLLAIGYVWLDKVEHKITADKHCLNCRKKRYEDMMDIRCKNKRSKHYGTMVDDYAVCDRWRG